MPELPEAETIVRGLRAHILHHRIRAIEFRPARYFRPFLERPLEQYSDSRIMDIFRHGKSVIMQLETADRAKDFIVVRLGMTGQLLLGGEADRHTHAVFELDEPGLCLRFRDQRQFGRIFFVSDWRRIFAAKIDVPAQRGGVTPRAHGVAEGSNPFSEIRLVPDPLEITPAEFLRIFRGRRGMIKAALMNQQSVMGVGNIYADESLFAARIHPRQRIERLSKRRLLDYFAVLSKTLHDAISLGGSSISDFVGATNSPGEFQIDHRVYGRTGEKCLRRGCGGIIKRILVSSRGTHFCPRCQRHV